MIVKITRGGHMAGAVAYLAADKEGVVREDPRVVGGLGRDGQALDAEAIGGITSDLDDPRRLFGTEVMHQGKPGHVWACALALDDADGVLSDDRWREIAEDFMGRMEFGSGVRWVAVRHGLNGAGCDHVHIVAGLVREDGTAVNDWDDQKRASRAANAVEHKFGLTVNESRELGVGVRGAHRVELEKAAAFKDGREPPSAYLERVVRACAIDAGDQREFFGRLRDHGVQVRPRYAKGSSEHVVGYSVALPASADAKPAWYGGGRLARDLSLPRLQERWRAPASVGSPNLAYEAHDTAGRLAAWSLEAERRPGPIARESREVGRYAQTRRGAGLTLTAGMAALLRERLQAANHAVERERERDEMDKRRGRSRGRELGPERGIEL